jgi:hypothetical protein
MDAAIALLGAACIIVSGALAWPWLSGRAEQRAEHRRDQARAAAPRPRAGLITGSQAGSPRGGPGHPDWPLPPRRQGPPPQDQLHYVVLLSQTGGVPRGSHRREQTRDLAAFSLEEAHA